MPAHAEEVLLSTRTHPKVLFMPLVIQLGLLVVHGAVWTFWPASTGFEFLDDYGQLIAHGVIWCVEFAYIFLPLLRWWNAVFTVTTHRVEERWGVLYKNSREIPFERIVSVSTERGILDRIFGCGTLIFQDAAVGDIPQTQNAFTARNTTQRSGIRFTDVPRVERVRLLVDDARVRSA